MTTVPAIPVENTAIVVVDPYNDFMSARGKLWPLLRKVSKQVNAIENLQRIVSVGRVNGIPIVYAPHRRFETGQFADRKYLHPSHVGIKSFRVFEDGKFVPFDSSNPADNRSTKMWVNGRYEVGKNGTSEIVEHPKKSPGTRNSGSSSVRWVGPWAVPCLLC